MSDYEKGFADARDKICDDISKIKVVGQYSDEYVVIDLTDLAKIFLKYGRVLSEEFLNSLPDDKRLELTVQDKDDD